MASAGTVFVDVLPDFSRFREQVRREMRNLGASIRPEMKQMSGGFDDVDSSASDATRSIGAFGDETRTTTPNVSAFGDEARAASKDTDIFRRTLGTLAPSFGGVGGAMNTTNRTMTFFRNGLKLIKFPAVILGLNVLAGAVAAVGSAATVAVAGLSPLTGLLAAYPGILAAVQQATGVVKLATVGLSDAFSAAFGTAEEFKESLEGMPEPARAIATEFRELVPRLERLRAIAAQGLLTPLRGEMTRLANIFLPMVQDAVRETAGVLGDLGKEAADLAASGPWRRDFATVLSNNVVVIDNFGKAGLLLADAFRNIVVAAQPLVLWISRVSVDVARAIEGFIQGARDSGALTDFFRLTRDVAEDLGAVLVNLGQTFINIGRAAFPFGKTMLKSVEDITQGWADFTGSVEGQRALTDYFEDARPVMREVARIVRDLFRGFADLSQSADIEHFLRRVRKDLLPIFFEIGKTASQGFGDALIDLAVGFGRLFKVFGSESGFLTMFVKTLAKLVDVIADLLDSNPALASFIVTLGAMRGIMAGLKFAGFITGLGGIATAAGGASTAVGRQGLLGTLMNFAKAHPVASLITGGFIGLAAAIKLSDDAAAEAEEQIRKLNRLILKTGGPNAPGNRPDPDRPGEERVAAVARGDARVFRGPAALNPQLGETVRKLEAEFRRYITTITHSTEATNIFADVMEGANGLTKKETHDLAFLTGVVVKATGGVKEHTQQLVRNAVQVGDAAGAQRALRDDLKGVFGQTQMTKDEVKRYGDELFKLPPRRHTEVTADTAKAKSELAAWIEQLRNTKVEISVGAAIEAGVPSGAARAHRLHSGGWIGGPGSSPRDVPMVGQMGEFVVERTQAERYRGLLEAINAGNKWLDHKDLLGTIKRGIDYHDGGTVGKPKVNFNFAGAQAGIAKVIEMVQAMGGYGGDLVAIGRQLQARGFLVGEHPAFGGVAPVHTTNSYHYQGRAIDINWPGADERTQLFALWHQLANSLGGSIKELFFNGLGIPVAVPHHEDHAHLAMDRGGIVDNRFGRRDLSIRQGRIKEAHIPMSGPGALPTPSLKGVRIEGVLDTPFGPAEMRGMIVDEVEEGIASSMKEHEEFQRRRARAY